MAEFGTFSFPQDLDILEFDFDDSGDEVLLSLVASDYVPLPASVKKHWSSIGPATARDSHPAFANYENLHVTLYHNTMKDKKV